MNKANFIEKQVAQIINYLKQHNLQNADREYALQMTEVLQGFFKKVVRKRLGFSQKIIIIFVDKGESGNN